MMKTMTAKLIVGGVCTLSMAAPIQAWTKYPPEGGVWNYGYTINGAYSDYLNQQQQHGSTVSGTDSRGNFQKNQAEAGPNATSHAFIRDVYSGASFYYNLYS